MKHLLIATLIALFIWSPVVEAQHGEVIIARRRASSAASPITFVQTGPNASATAGVTTLNVTTTSGSVTAGHTLVVAMEFAQGGGGGTQAISSITSTSCQGNAFTISAASRANTPGSNYANLYTQFAYTTTPITGGTCTIALNFSSIVGSPTSGFVSANIIELSGGSFNQTATQVSVVGSVSAGPGYTCSPTACLPPSYTPGANGSLTINAVLIDDNNGFGSGWYTAGSPFTILNQNGGGKEDIATEYYAQSTVSALTGTFVSNYPATTGPWVDSMITFKP